MFYSTTIKAVGYGGALDIRGNWLTFIGYLPVQVGDTVFTDGNVIFGNVPPKSSVTNINLEASGIPVLAANLQGYFNRRGVFKSYPVAGELWIVNSTEIFAHDLSFDDNEIIDAFISEAGQSFIATGGIYKKSTQLDIHYPLDITNSFNNVLSCREWDEDNGHYNIDWRNDYGYRYFDDVKTKACPLILGSEKFGNFNIPLRIFNDGVLAQSFDLKTYGDIIESYALQCADDILAQSYDYYDDNATTFAFFSQKWKAAYDASNVSVPTSDARDGAVDLPDDAVNRPSTFIAHTCAHVLTCNLNENGFSGIVFASSYGYCFPYIESRFMHSYHPKADHDNLYNARHTQEWKCVPFGSSAIFVISNGVLQEIVSLRNFGGLNSSLPTTDGPCALGIKMWEIISSYCYNHVRFFDIITDRHIDFLPSENYSPALHDLFPVGDGFFKFNAESGSLSFFDSKRQSIATDVPINDFLYVQAQDCFFSVIGDITSNAGLGGSLRYGNIARDYRSRWTIPFNDKPDYIRLKTYPDERTFSSTLHTQIDSIDDNYAYQFQNNHKARDDAYDFSLDSPWRGNFSSSNWLPPFDGFYRKDGNTIENLHFTPLFYDFKNGSYLYGIKGGNLYLKSQGSVTQVASNCKNFRLHELNKISKAKS